MSKINIDAYDNTVTIELQSGHQDLFKDLETALEVYLATWNNKPMMKLYEVIQVKNRSTR